MKKATKILAGGGLALMFGLGTLFGVLVAQMNSTHATTSGTTASSSSAQLGDSAPKPQENLVAGGEALNLNPQTDETIFTTESGIEIKSHNLSATGSATSIQYFTLGSYNGTPVNWLIVGVSNNGIHPDSTDAGEAILAANANGKIVTGTISSSLSSNQILCVSQYAFNQETYTPNFVAHGNTNVTNISAYNANYSISSDQATDYYSSFTEFPNDVLTKSLNLGTTLGLNGLYGGDIVKNTTFSSNYVFSLSSSHYTTFVGATNYKIPYLFTATSTATNVYSANMTHTKSVLSSITEKTYPEGTIMMGPAPPVGQGSVRAELNNLILSTGVSGKVTTANLTATCSKVLGDRPNYYFTTYYSATNYSNTLAYRPAFVMQL